MPKKKPGNKEKSGKKSANNTGTAPQIFVTGDKSIDRFIYIKGFPDEPANLRETWVSANRFWSVDHDGGAGCLLQLLKKDGMSVEDPCPGKNDSAQSIYILTQANKAKKWCVGQAIVAGEREYPSGDLTCDERLLSGKAPAVIIDFNQGWLKNNRNELHNFLKDRTFIIRTHDPRKDDWKKLRQMGTQTGVWFSPIQDMADGSLWFPGNWENLHKRLLEYLQIDDTLWQKGQWQHYIVVQIAYDGALVVGPGMPEQGELLIFKGDQPDSFTREGYGTVVAGGIVFVYSLIQSLLSSTMPDSKVILDCARTGLARIRKVVTEGYTGPVDGESDWNPSAGTNLPVEALNKVNTGDIIAYTMKSPAPDWDTACEIVCGDEEKLREKTVFKLGWLVTCSPEYAHILLRLSSRLKNHIYNDKEVLSFSLFGGPGSGKSFVARQIAKAIDPDDTKFRHKTFNLSQLNDPARLIDAFKMIQSICLQGKIPFILWDEFDTSFKGDRAGWLSSFLMPMQDAEFFDGMTNQKLGKCVFVFIGGTFEDDREFSEWTLSEDGRRLKGTDFHSRLDSSLNVPSVDLKGESDDLFNTPDEAKLVRAVMIRTFLQEEKRIKTISPDVLSFLLHVPLQHGVRSLQRIISASELRKTTNFQTFHLPPLDVLQLHVNEAKIPRNKSVISFLNDIKLEMFQYPLLELEWRTS